MQKPLQITFRGMDSSPFVEARIRELAARLERFDDGITSCHVTIQSPPQHHRQGGLYDVKIRLGVRDGEVFVDREGSQNHAHEDVYVVLRDAFDAAVRQVEDRARRRDHRTRRHAEEPSAASSRRA